MAKYMPINGPLRPRPRHLKSIKVFQKAAALLFGLALSLWVFFNISKIKTPEPVHPLSNKVYKFYDHGFSYHDTNFTCPVAWEWTRNITEADVVWANILDHGSRRATELRAYPGQLAAFMSLEPVTYYSFLYDMKTDFGYNFSVDYRIWDGHPHGKADIPAVFLHNPYEEQWGLQNLRKWPTMPKRKDAAMAVFISNCGALNNRNELVNELMEHLSVHSYGQCWHNKEVENPDPNLDRFTEKQKICGEYHFLFASEDSNEDAYVTEKVYDALLSGALPVYLGSRDITRYIPDPSAIVNVADFPSVAALAEYLIELTKSEEKYLRHFEWKKREFCEDFKRVLRLAARTVQCRLAMKLEGLDFEKDLHYLDIFPPEN